MESITFESNELHYHYIAFSSLPLHTFWKSNQSLGYKLFQNNKITAATKTSPRPTNHCNVRCIDEWQDFEDNMIHEIYFVFFFIFSLLFFEVMTYLIFFGPCNFIHVHNKCKAAIKLTVTLTCN